MATSHAVMFNAPADKVWGTLIKVVTTAGYPVAKTDQAAKQIIYQASSGGFTWAQKISVGGASAADGSSAWHVGLCGHRSVSNQRNWRHALLPRSGARFVNEFVVG